MADGDQESDVIDTPRLDLEQARKRFVTLQALFAMRGFSLDRLTAGQGFRVSRWGWSVDLPDLRGVAEFGLRAGIDL